MEKYSLTARLFITGEVQRDIKIVPIGTSEQYATVLLKIDDTKLDFRIVLYNNEAIKISQYLRKGDTVSAVLIPREYEGEVHYYSEYIKRLNR